MTDPSFDGTPEVRGGEKSPPGGMAAKKQEAFAAAQQLAKFLREKYGCTRVVGIGSAFNEKQFTEHSDIDLVVYGLPEGKYFSILSEISELTSFPVDLIPVEAARPQTLQRVEQEGVEL
ncbi:MAG: nucleotidyltransferase domain-containing protein [candidate division KSB1 bacterium]|nr:nucleotidyltransferase domain-containing protein [candidate division KSB1 bacterium]